MDLQRRNREKLKQTYTYILFEAIAKEITEAEKRHVGVTGRIARSVARVWRKGGSEKDF